MIPFLLVLSSPSGVGKTSIAKMLLQGRDDLAYSVSATTRAPRGRERDGVEYHFLSPAEFSRCEAAGEFLESARYAGHRYGTLRREVERIFAAGQHAVLDIEVQGARQIRGRFPNSLHVFLLPPSAEALLERLSGRRTEDRSQVKARLEHAIDELGAVGDYDFVVNNDDLVTAVGQVAAILDSEARRVTRQDTLSAFTEELTRKLRSSIDKFSEN